MRHALDICRLLLDPRVVLPPLRTGRTLAAEQSRRDRAASSDCRWWSRLRRQLAGLEFLRRFLRRETLRRHRGKWVINSFFPPFPSPAYDRLFTKFLPAPRWKPLSAFLALTYDCPSDCWHCSAKARSCDTLLQGQQWLNVLSQLVELGTSLVAFTGGEPLLNPHLAELVKEADRGGIVTQIFTSGIGATPTVWRELSDAGLWGVGVSLDDTNPDVVNRLRGSSLAYISALAALERARDAGLYTFINALATGEMVRSGEHIRIYGLAEQLGLQEVRFIEPKPCGRLGEAGSAHSLSATEVAVLRSFHRTQNRRRRGPKVCAFSEIESEELFGCVAGTAHMYIDPAGNVCPCDFTPLPFGNVRTESLNAIWMRMSRSIGQPRCHCLAETIDEQLGTLCCGKPQPTTPDLSCRIAAGLPPSGLPDFFQTFSQPWGLLSNTEES